MEEENNMIEQQEYKIDGAIKNFGDYQELAKRFISIQPIFYDKAKNWWLWNFKDLYWEMIDETDLFVKFDNAIDYSGSVMSQQKSAILEALKRVGRKNIPKNAKKTWIQFKAGIIDIETNSEIEASPDFFITNPIPWELGNIEDTPIMDKIFEQWVGKDYILTLYEIIGFCMLPDYPIHRIFCFTGSGSNGKSKFLELIRKLIGKVNACSSDLNKLTKSNFETAKLYKKLACFMAETDFSVLNNTALIKQLTGEDVMGFEFKNKNPFDDINYAKLLIATNSLPITEDKTRGFYRRWLIIDFPNEFSEEKNILNDIPEEEYKNLARKSVIILKHLLQKRAFHNDGTLDERKKRYEEKSDYFQKYIDEECNINVNAEMPFQKFSMLFTAYCEEKGLRRLSSNHIGRLLKGKGFVTKNKKI